jgi:type VI secretion system secreted protein VgrG
MSSLLQSLSALIQGRQNNRILRLSFPHDDGPRAQLLVNKLDAVESLSRDFEFTIELLSDDPALALKDLQGKLFNVELVRGDGSLRYFSGFCYEFSLLRTDGGISFYQARLGPWLQFLRLRIDNFIFHGKTLREQMESIFNDYGTLPNWDFRVSGEDAAMTDAIQFGESDYNYLHRRIESRGWLYHYVHDAQGHKLVFSDDSTRAEPVDGGPEIKFQRHGGATEEDGIGEFSSTRKIVPSNVTLGGFNFKNPKPFSAGVPTLNKQGSVPDIEVYEYAGAYGVKNIQDADKQSRLRMEEIEATGKHFEAVGNNRFVVPGCWFRLTNHFAFDLFANHEDAAKSEFLIISVHHVATNNYLQEAGEQASYTNTLTCIRKSIPWRPGRGFNSIDTRITYPQTATVVGPSGQGSVHTDEYGRIRIQFHWDRIGNNDEKSSTWVRYASSWAGAELGGTMIPRVGSEVICQWLDGNPDRPIITGSVYNQQNMPPWKLASQQSLMGFRSRELTPNGGNQPGGRSNHMILDDTPGQIQAVLSSDHYRSQLNLGYLTRVQGTSGRQDYRGEGYELRTDGWGALRAAKGLLVTAWGQAVQDQGTTQQDNAEGADTLRAVLDSAENRSSAAEMASAQRGDNKHSHRGLKNQKELHENSWSLSKPIIFLSAPEGVATSTPKSIVHAAGGDLASYAVGNLDMTSGEIISISSAKGIQQHVERGGMSTVLSHGDHYIHVQDGKSEIVSQKSITLEAKSGDIVLKTKGGSIVLTESGEIRIKGASETHEIQGAIQLGAAQVVNSGSVAAAPSSDFWGKMNIGKFSQKLVFADALHKVAGKAAGYGYKIVSKDGAVLQTGKLDESGKTARVFTEDMEELHAEVDVNQGKWQFLEDVKHDLGLTSDDLAAAPTPIGIDLLADKTQLPVAAIKELFKSDGSIEPASTAMAILENKTNLPASTIINLVKNNGEIKPHEILADMVEQRVNEASGKLLGLLGGSWKGGDVPHDVQSQFEKAATQRTAKLPADQQEQNTQPQSLPGNAEDLTVLSESDPLAFDMDHSPADQRVEHG